MYKLFLRRLSRGAFLLLFISISSASISNPGFTAQPACPSWANPNTPIVKNLYQFRKSIDGEPVNIGPALDKNSFYWTQGVWFEMPIGYQNPHSGHRYWWSFVDKDKYIKLLTKNSFLTGYDPTTQSYNYDLIEDHVYPTGFSFWMPNIRYVERNIVWVPWYRPCESGRPQPTTEQYVVKFVIKWPFLSNSLNSGPGREFRIIQNRLAEKRLLLGQGAKIYEHTYDGPITGGKQYYIFHDDGDIIVNLSCRPYRGSNAPVNPSCTGSIWQRSSDLILGIRFPSSEGQQGNEQRWQAPVNAAIKLATEWHQN